MTDGTETAVEPTAPEQREQVLPPPPPAYAAPVRSTPLWVRLAGGYGVVAILGAFFLVSHERVEPRLLFLMLNLTGALALALLAFKRSAWMPLVLNLTWAAIAASATWRLFV